MTTRITQPDNPADTVITLTISGNRLVAICNALQGLIYASGKLEFEWYQMINETVEQVRDELARQRALVARSNMVAGVGNNEFEGNTMDEKDEKALRQQVNAFAVAWEQAHGYQPAAFQKAIAWQRLQRGQSIQEIVKALTAQRI